MIYTIQIDLSNDAFQQDPDAEIARILRAHATLITWESHEGQHVLRDVNGNTVGIAELRDTDTWKAEGEQLKFGGA